MSDESKYDWFATGLRYNIPMCCILFFCFEWQNIKENVEEYSELMCDGLIPCPKCIGRKQC